MSTHAEWAHMTQRHGFIFVTRYVRSYTRVANSSLAGPILCKFVGVTFFTSVTSVGISLPLPSRHAQHRIASREGGGEHAWPYPASTLSRRHSEMRLRLFSSNRSSGNIPKAHAGFLQTQMVFPRAFSSENRRPLKA